MRQTPETIGDAILLYVREQYGTQVAAAIALQCSTTMLNEVIHGARRPTERMLTAIGYRHVETWLPMSAPLPASALPLDSGVPATGNQGSSPTPAHVSPESRIDLSGRKE